ncbi:Integral membrane protein TerC family protein [Planctomycetes bacterium Pla163]|uniref:Integral membrane protein TerC family protein n=1 Tax=Rohdeia mirabilis TaxID=2528008 RepID=A0A518CVV1_9BACT|nr:Integral membrane protein TerC family protein [Planctomycetes bacterium Pla163]
MELLTSPEAWIALLTLTAIEIVLGIDNVVFIAILASRLPPEQQARARFLGLAAALVSRIILLLLISVIVALTEPLFTVLGNEISGRDLVLLAGGVFLLGKSTVEIHSQVEGLGHEHKSGKPATMASVVAQIFVLDVVFSLDSVITAIGLADDVPVMIAAIVVAMGVMMVAAGRISAFIDKHPTLKVLALSFLLLIGLTLVVEAFEIHVPKGYVYFAMAFSLGVEMLNIRARVKRLQREAKASLSGSKSSSA